MENKNNVVSHTLLRHKYLLVSIDDEVATLIIATLLCIIDDLLFFEDTKMAELGSDHDRNLSNLNFVILE